MKKEYIQPKIIAVRFIENLMTIQTSKVYENEEGWAKKQNNIYDDDFDETFPTESYPDEIYPGNAMY